MMKRDPKIDLIMQDIMFVCGDRIVEPRSTEHCTRFNVAKSTGETSEKILRTILGRNDQTKINDILARLYGKYDYPPDELDPEIDKLIETYFQRRCFWGGAHRDATTEGSCFWCSKPAAYRLWWSGFGDDRNYRSCLACDDPKHVQLSGKAVRQRVTFGPP